MSRSDSSATVSRGMRRDRSWRRGTRVGVGRFWLELPVSFDGVQNEPGPGGIRRWSARSPYGGVRRAGRGRVAGRW